MSTDRVRALADGIFAFAMTLLVLDLKGIQPNGKDFWQQLSPLLTKLFPYVLSFIILGLYWTGHYAEFHFIKRTTRMHLWINILLLMFVALVPFSASLLTERALNQFSVIIYGVNLIAIGVAFYVQWSYATHNRRLVDADLDPRLIWDVKKRILGTISFFILALGVSFWNPILSLILYLMIQLFYLLRTSQTVTGAPAEIEQSV
ncbi:MAG: TMEM175 family protein [Chloroflexia bacterium]